MTAALIERKRSNVAVQNSDTLRKFRAEIDQWIEPQQQVENPLGPGGTAPLDPQSLERLRSLGYIGGKTTK